MKVVPQYKVIGPYNYDRIIHNIKKNYTKRQDIGQTSGKMNLRLKINSRQKNYLFYSTVAGKRFATSFKLI